MNYYISDLHFFARSQIDNGDVVYILGDLGMRGQNELLIELVAKLKGRKILIKGNHDDVTDYRYKQLFEQICEYKEVSDSFEGKSYKLVLNHYPILMWNGQHKGNILLYGHTHRTEEDLFFQKCITAMNAMEKIRHENETIFRAINVGCMCSYMDYEPRGLKELLESSNIYE